MLGRPLDVNVCAGSARGIQAPGGDGGSGAYRGTRVLPSAARDIATLHLFWLIGTDRAKRRGTYQQKQDE